MNCKVLVSWTFGNQVITLKESIIYFLMKNIISAALIFLCALPAFADVTADKAMPKSIESYGDRNEPNLWRKLSGRVVTDPFNVLATAIFLCAILHTFAVAKFRAISHRFEHEYEILDHQWSKSREPEKTTVAHMRDQKKFFAVVFHFLGEVEVVFGIWVIPLIFTATLMKGAKAAIHYINEVNFTEPIFVAVIMAIASSRPILYFAETCLRQIAKLGRGTPLAWWLSILIIGPMLGSLITEPAAMTICALLLANKFYKLHPSMPLRYATLGLLFVNISVGGTLTHFAAPPVIMVAGKWHWGLPFMLSQFGWKAALGILVAAGLALVIFRRELFLLRDVDQNTESRPRVPGWIVIAHLLFIALLVAAAHYPAIVILTFMLFLAFVQATEPNQDLIQLKSPVLVGFFLAGLVIHGGCQQWWIEPVLSSLSPLQMLFGATILTAFNDNAAITYLASLVPAFSLEAKYAVVAGAVAGGGLTVIANAPNPAGQSILQPYFGKNGIDAIKLLIAALAPTIIMIFAFLLLP